MNVIPGMPSAHEVHQAAVATAEELAVLGARPDEVLNTKKELVSGWAVCQHLEHVSIVNGRTLEFVSALLAAPNAVEQGTLSEIALAVLGGGAIPAGRQAPQFVQPKGIALGQLRAHLDTQCKAVREFGSRLDALSSGTATRLHPTLGPLTALQWLRFHAIHNEHHLKILRKIVG